MADNLPPVVIELKLQAEQMQAQLKAVTSQLEGMGAKAKEQTSKLEGMASAGKHIAAAFVAFAGFEFLKKSSEVAVENAKSFKLLELQMQNSTGATHEQVKAVDEQLEVMSKQNAVLMPDLRDNYEKLIRVTRNSAEALRLEGLAQNIAAGTGKNLSVVSIALARAYDGNWMSLNKLVPGVKTATDKMKFLDDTFKGAAETAANADPYARLNKAMEDLHVAFGEALVPALTAAVGWFQQFVDIIKPFIPIILGLAAGFVTYQVALAAVSAGQAIYNGVVALSTIATEGFTMALASTGIGAIAIAVGLLTAALLGLNAAAASAGSAPSKAAVAAGEAARKAAEKAYYKTRPYDPKAPVAVGAEQGKESLAAGEAAYNAAVKKVKDAEDAAAAKKALDKIMQDQKDAASKLNTSTTAPATNGVVSAYAKFRQSLLNLQAKFNEDSQNLLSQHIDNVAQIITDKKGELTDAFKQATQVDSGSLLAQVGGSITNMIAALRDKLSSAKKLSDDAGRLAGLGYSQEFVQQIIAQGPVMGDQLAQQLFNATPEQAAQVQDLLGKVTDFASTGVESTAQKFATSQSFLVGALKDENTAYANSLNQLVRDNEVAMAKLQISRDNSAIKALQAGGVTAAEAKNIRNYKSDIAAENKIVAAGGVTVNLSTTNLTSPQQTATEIVNAIKFNTPVTVTSGGAVTR